MRISWFGWLFSIVHTHPKLELSISKDIDTTIVLKYIDLSVIYAKLNKQKYFENIVKYFENTVPSADILPEVTHLVLNFLIVTCWIIMLTKIQCLIISQLKKDTLYSIFDILTESHPKWIRQKYYLYRVGVKKLLPEISS